MKVFICGIDGYIGWALAQHLIAAGHHVGGLDVCHRRRWVKEVGGCSVIPIEEAELRRRRIPNEHIDMVDYNILATALKKYQPHAIVHLAEQPSAAYSMKGPAETRLTQYINVIGSTNLLWAMKEACPYTHLIKLGTMGEYGSPEGEIPEGKPSEFPRAPGSLYHATKVADSVNCELASDKWGLSITDIMQAIVYGTRWQRNGKSPDSPTRFDVDECFGTVINRFVAQVVSGQAMTIYGVGGQTRGFLPLSDSVKCIERLIDTPAAIGEYRVVNQLAEWMTISEVAIQVRESIGGEIEYIDNPRIENESHKYNVRTDTLNDLGYSGDRDMQGIIGEMHEDLSRGAKDLILKVDMKPTVKWR